MVEHERQFESEAEPGMPPELADDLAKLYGSSVDVPPQVDAAILASAREQLVNESLRGAEGDGIVKS
jgi:hypothetical protein